MPGIVLTVPGKCASPRPAALALKLIDLGRQRHPARRNPAQHTRQALDRLRERYQQINPVKFILDSGLAGADLSLSRLLMK